MAVRATWHDAVLAVSDHTLVVGDVTYFPREAVQWDRLRKRRADVDADIGSDIVYDLVVDHYRGPGGATLASGRDVDPRVRGLVRFGPEVAVTAVARGLSDTTERERRRREVAWLWCGR